MEVLRRDDTAAVGTDKAPSSRRLRYLSSLDGLRAVAVLGVVAYHAEPDVVTGGFLGVDVFFVVSGFLITSLLLRERASERRIDLRRFWRRRARRLGPALLAVLSTVAVAGWFWTPADQLGRLRGDGLATLGYVMNWRLIAEGDRYFDTFADPSPLRHMWSLAIEEQFYLGWPLLVAGVLAWRRSLLGPLAVAVGGASIAAMALIDGSLSRLYYGTDTRLHVVMTGCVLGVLANRRPAVIRRITPSPAVALVATAVAVAAMVVVTDDDAGFYPWGMVTFSLVSAIAVAGCARHGDVPLLSHPLLVGIGKRSYGLYVWHWPVQVFLTDERIGLGHAGSTLVRLAVMTLMTLISYAVIEQPVRRSHAPLPRWWPLLPVAVGVLLVVTTLGATTSPFAEAKPGEVRTIEPSVPATDSGESDAPEPPPIRSMLLLGDSTAVSMESALAHEFANRGVEATIATHTGCGVTRGIAVDDIGEVPAFAPGCPDELNRQNDVIAAIRPDLVLVMAYADSFPRRLDGLDDEDGEDGEVIAPETHPEVVLSLLDEAATRLSSHGAVVAFTLPAEVTVREPEPTNSRIVAYRELLRRLASTRDDVVLVDLAGFVCPDQECLDEIDGTTLRSDGIHYSDESAPLITPVLVEMTLEAVRKL